MAPATLPKNAELARLLPDYKFEARTLGIGSTSMVKKALHEKNGVVAIKVIPLQNSRGEDVTEAIEREISILKTLLDSRYVIQLYDVVYTQFYTFIVMEYAPQRDLFEYITERMKLNEEEARPFFRQLIAAVEDCHGKMIAHRDLKLENLLLDGNMNLKLSDFGLSAKMSDDFLLQKSCGSPHYAAPEVLLDAPYEGPPADVWSCGVVLYVILCGQYPFDAETPVSLFDKIKVGRFEFPEHLSDDARDLIAGMLTVNPAQRLTIPKIYQHPWFQA